MANEVLDLLLDVRPRERAAGVSLLLSRGWSPAAILAELPYLPHELVSSGDASRDVRSARPGRPAPADPRAN